MYESDHNCIYIKRIFAFIAAVSINTFEFCACAKKLHIKYEIKPIFIISIGTLPKFILESVPLYCDPPIYFYGNCI